MTRLAQSISRLDLATSRLGEVERVMDHIANIPKEVLDEIVKAAAMRLRAKVVQYLLANFARSGIQSRTGKLMGALRRTTVTGYLSGSGAPRLRIAMPSGVNPYTAGARRSNFYEVAGALNYGAVRAGMERRAVVDIPTGRTVRTERRSKAGARAKRTIKKHALGMQASDRAIDAIEDGRTNSTTGKQIIAGLHVGVKSGETKNSVQLSSGVTVIKPRSFFKLTRAQEMAVVKDFEYLIVESVKKAMNL